MLAEQKKQREEFLKREKAKKEAEEKKKREAEEKKKKIQEEYERIKNEHGGITGTEDTGYDDSLMSTYLKREDPAAASFVLLDARFKTD